MLYSDDPILGLCFTDPEGKKTLNIHRETSYMVYRPYRGQAPRVGHATLEDAMAEADRLCHKEDDLFVVLEVKIVKACKPSSPPVSWLEIEKVERDGGD